ncbi:MULTISPECIES: hypothetical protein [Arthrobacter]|uniref:DUF308 domain-containing protein n=1 Tax=Arthrobacter jinronghuae TaxID=2964609 RepID=A0ABT1NQ61_9MICC|nr:MULTISPECIES: hypothetical protein [Arthrobacter]MCQ1949726.1 hypothetical protein [Arthrobacter jinronghuae]MCQ1953873.1 hypothetical protein [Arthrobacter sp. zg-Y238]UWX79879.1 hypothetical protein N2K98_06745 [Arthrobacter jinronghuae]
MSEREPEHNESTDEEVWLDLVARLEHMDASDPVHPEPGQSAGATDAAAPHGSGETGQTTPSRDPAAPTPAERTRAIFENQPLASAGPRDYISKDEDEDDGGFVPPEPPPLGTGEPLVVLSWLGTLAGPLLLLVFAMFWRSAPLPVILGTIAVFAGSAAYLLFRLPQHRDEDDDGAAV